MLQVLHLTQQSHQLCGDYSHNQVYYSCVCVPCTMWNQTYAYSCIYMYVREWLKVYIIYALNPRDNRIFVYAQIINSIKLVKFQPCVHWKSVTLMYICIIMIHLYTRRYIVSTCKCTFMYVGIYMYMCM